jgi:transposase
MSGRLWSWTTFERTKARRSGQPSRRKAVNYFSRPRYSPDLSPIEEAFSKLKTALRRAGARTREALEEAIAQALLSITVKSAQGWFQHCGYLLPAQEGKR